MIDNSLPVGSIVPYGGNVLSSQIWKICDGSSLMKTDYPELFSQIGYQFGGSGDTFNLPNQAEASLIGYSTSSNIADTLGDVIGENQHTITINEMPSHMHYFNSDLSWSLEDGGYASFKTGTHQTTINNSILDTSNTGGNQAMSLVSKSIVVNYIIKVKSESSQLPSVQFNGTVNQIENTINKVTEITENSTDIQYPSAKSVYTSVKDKVDKIEGKGLSTNDYSDTEKAKVDSALQSDDIEQTYSATSENAQSGKAVAEALQNEYTNILTTPATLADSNGGKLSNIDIVGKSFQDGTPTPTAPIAIQNTGNTLNLVSCGKNLLPYPYTDTTKTASGITFTDNGDGTITANGTATGFAIFRVTNTNGSFLTDNGFLSGCPDGGSDSTYYMRLIYYKDNIYNNTSLTDAGSGVAVNTPQGDSDAQFVYIGIVSGTTVSNLVFKPQLEVETSATSYEPYQDNNYTIPLTDINGTSHTMRQFDEVKKHNDGKWYFDCNSVIKSFDGTESWTYGNAYFTYILSPKSSPINRNQFLSTKYKNAVGQNLSFRTDSSGNWLGVMDSNYTTVDTWKAQLATWNTAGNPLTVLYQKETTTSYELSASTSAILENIAIQKGNANIYFTNAVAPTMTADYLQNLQLYCKSLEARIEALENIQ